jgi:hypothetical protein
MNRLLLLVFSVLLSALAMASDNDARESVKSEKPEKEKEKSEKKESIIDYFNLLPKISREFVQSEEFTDYEGLEIRNIDVFVFDRFSEPISLKSIQHFEEKDSSAHKANKKLVYRQLIFKEGDKLDPLLMADAERFLRENTIYTDAYIRVVPTEDCRFADIQVYVQDNRHWRAIFWASPTSITVGAGAYDFAGLPQSLSISGSGLFTKNNPYSFDLMYGLKNIARSQIDMNVHYFRQNIAQTSRIELDKQFVAYNTKWAGKVDVAHTMRKETESGFADEISPDYNTAFIFKDVWMARSLPLPHLSEKNKFVRFVISGRATTKHHLFRPDNLPVQNFVNRQFYLASFGIANRNWYGIEELYRFRDYDYVPKGFNFAVLGGYEVNEFLGGRYYSGFTANYNRMYGNWGYLQKEIRYGAFLRDKNYEQITTQMRLNYFTKRFEMGRMGFRQFVKANTILSYNRPETEFFSFSNSIRGLQSNNIRMFGTKSFVLNLESVFYTPVKWWTSRGNFFLFADLGFVSRNEQQLLFKSTLHQGYGAGIRFQHLVTAINYLQISIGYYPTGQMVNLNPVGFNIQAHPDRMIEHNNLFNSGIMTGIN